MRHLKAQRLLLILNLFLSQTDAALFVQQILARG